MPSSVAFHYIQPDCEGDARKFLGAQDDGTDAETGKGHKRDYCVNKECDKSGSYNEKDKLYERRLCLIFNILHIVARNFARNRLLFSLFLRAKFVLIISNLHYVTRKKSLVIPLVIARNFHSFTSDHTDLLPTVSLTILPSSRILRRMLSILFIFCLSSSWSDKTSQRRFTISCFVRLL